MNYIVLDLEWNQSSAPRKYQLKKLTFEIIEIGAVKLDEEGHEIDRFQAYIYPKVYDRMNRLIYEVTGITMKLLKAKGKPFEYVMDKFIRWCGEDYIYCTWGDMDLTELQLNCDYYNMKGLFKKPLYFCDLQKIYSLQFDNGKIRRNLKSVVDDLGIEEPWAFHGAYFDARYTAEVLKKLDMKTYGRFVSVDYHRLPENADEEIFLDFGTYTKHVSHEYQTKEEALEDKNVTVLTCYKCKKNLRKKIQWFTPNGKQFYAIGVCREHGWLKGKLRIKKGNHGGVFVVKTQKLVGDEAVLDIKNKQLDVRKKRKKARAAGKE